MSRIPVPALKFRGVILQSHLPRPGNLPGQLSKLAIIIIYNLGAIVLALPEPRASNRPNRKQQIKTNP